MRVAVAAYLLLIEIARAHEGISRPEARLIKRYRDALGVEDQHLLEETRTPVVDRLVEGAPKEREEAILAMARVACADGFFSKLERARIMEVADRLGVGRVQAANIFEQVEHEMGARRTRIVQWVVSVAAAFTIVGFLFHEVFAGDPTEELMLIAEDLEPSIVYIRTEYLLRDRRHPDAKLMRRNGEGTGFFVSSDGLIVTAKHVLEPWRYSGTVRKMLDETHDLVEGSVRWTAWPANTRIREGRRDWIFDTGYDTANGTLAEHSRAADRLVRDSRSVEGSRKKHVGMYLPLDDSDLVVLKAAVDGSVKPIPLSNGTPRRKPIVLLGFPHGSGAMESFFAKPVASDGTIGKVENTLLINARTYPGDSGGPLIDLSGEVVGVASRRFGPNDDMGKCIQVKYLRELLGL